MDKKLLLIIVIAVILIAAGGYLILINPSNGGTEVDSPEIPLKKQDFKLFEIEVPEGSNFTIKNEADGMKFYKNNGNFSAEFSGIIVSKGQTESLIGDASVSISNSSSQQIYASELKNETIFKCVSNHGDVDIVLIGNDLILLKKVSESIKIKDVGNL